MPLIPFLYLEILEENQLLVGQRHIIKNYNILIDGNNYRPYNFIKLLRNTKNGAYGTGYVKEINKTLETAYKRILYELDLMRTGGNKKGFLKSSKHLDEKGMKELKKAGADIIPIMSYNSYNFSKSQKSFEKMCKKSQKSFDFCDFGSVKFKYMIWIGQ